MYTYRRKYRIGPGSIFFMILFILITIGMGYLFYMDKGKFWDMLPFVCIPVIIISLILIIFNFTRRTRGSSFFVVFFLLSLTGLILSNFFGPFALKNKAEKSFDNKDYSQSINYYNTLLNNYPNSKLADNALEKISYAYYSNGNYTEAIDSFKKAIDSEIFGDDNLKIKNILEKCYTKLALDYHKNEKYSQSAESYLNAVEVLEDIKSNFPDTNEAFIAIYKIPEYLYKAALNFNKTKNWEKSIESLENIINNYNDSEYFYKAGYLLSNNYINKAIELVNNFNYVEGAEEFLKILDLEVQNNNYNNISDYEKRKVFHSIPPNTLKSIARDKYNSGSYKKASFLYEIIVEYNPELEKEINPLLIDSKLKLIASSNHTSLVPAVPERKFWGPEKSILIIENNTEFDLTVYLKGPEYKIIIVEKNSTSDEIEISAGTYEAASELTSPDILPYYGKEVTYDEGQKYRVKYPISD
jgi:tetratricopeptide (TPR) repeat protein